MTFQFFGDNENQKLSHGTLKRKKKRTDVMETPLGLEVINSGIVKRGWNRFRSVVKNKGPIQVVPPNLKQLLSHFRTLLTSS